MPDLSAAFKPLVRREVERALDALVEASASADARRAPRSPLATALLPHVSRLPGTARARLARAQALVARMQASTAAAEEPVWARVFASQAPAPAAARHLDLGLTSLRCVEDTRESGDDEIWLGLVRVVVDFVEPITHTTEILGPFSMGTFREGVLRNFTPPFALGRVSVTGAPRTVTTAMMLAEVDFGGLGDVLEVMARGINDELVVKLVHLGVTLVAPGSTLFSQLGPAGYSGAAFLAAEVSAAVGYAMGWLMMSILSMVQDELFEPVMWSIPVPQEPTLGYTQAASNRIFERKHARYQASFEWRAAR